MLTDTPDPHLATLARPSCLPGNDQAFVAFFGGLKELVGKHRAARQVTANLGRLPPCLIFSHLSVG